MRMHRSVALFASLSLSGLALAAEPDMMANTGTATTRPATQPQAWGDHRSGMGQGMGQAAWALPAGFEAKDLKDAKDIKDHIAEVTDAAVSHDGFDNVVRRLADNDRDRLKDAKDKKWDDLNQVAARITQQWKQKYNQDFKLEDHRDMVFNDSYRVIQGEVTDPATAMANWPVQPIMPMRGEAMPAAGREKAAAPAPGEKVSDRGPVMEKIATPFKETAVEKTELEKGRKVALVEVPESHGQPAVRLSLLRELPDNWKLDIPNNISGQQVHDNLLKHLTWVADHQNEWPGDVNDGYRMVSHHVLLALYGADTSMTGQMDRMNEGRMDRMDDRTNRTGDMTPAPADRIRE